MQGKSTYLPGEVCVVSLKGLRGPRGLLTTAQKSAHRPNVLRERCSGRKRTSVLENVLGHTMSDTITVLNSYQERRAVISTYPKNLE